MTLARRRIPATLPAPRRAARLHAHSSLRPARESHASSYGDAVSGSPRPPPDLRAAPPESIAVLLQRLTGVDLSHCAVVRRGADADHRDRRARHSTTGYVMRSSSSRLLRCRITTDRRLIWKRSASRLPLPGFLRGARARRQADALPTCAPVHARRPLPARTRRSTVSFRHARAALQSP